METRGSSKGRALVLSQAYSVIGKGPERRRAPRRVRRAAVATVATPKRRRSRSQRRDSLFRTASAWCARRPSRTPRGRRIRLGAQSLGGSEYGFRLDRAQRWDPPARSGTAPYPAEDGYGAAWGCPGVTKRDCSFSRSLGIRPAKVDGDGSGLLVRDDSSRQVAFRSCHEAAIHADDRVEEQCAHLRREDDRALDRRPDVGRPQGTAI